MICYQDIEFSVSEIKWERIFLNFTIKTNYEGKVAFCFARIQKNADDDGAESEFVIKEKVAIQYETYKNNEYYFSVNMAAVDGRSFLNNGTWYICALADNNTILAHAETSIAYEFDRLSRVFRYGRKKYAYTVTFDIVSDDSNNLIFSFASYFMIMNKTWKKRRYVQEAFSVRGKLNRIMLYAVICGIRMFYHVMAALTHKDGSHVLFMTENKDYLGGNLKYIYERMLERGLNDKFVLSCSCRKAVGEHVSAISWIKTIYKIAKQDYIFIDDYTPVFGFFKLDKRTKLIQVWHAGEGFKSVGYSRFGKAGSPFPAESSHKAYKYALTGSPNLIKTYEEVFGIEREAFLPLGMARLDGFLDEKKIESFREDFYKKYPSFVGKKIVLFAPTFRGTGKKNAYYEYDKIDFKRIYEFCGDEWIFLIKMHPFVKERVPIPAEYNDKIIDFFAYQNINDLYYVTDVLVTDYSSNYYEYALLKKPVIFYTYDREFYELTRGVHRSIKDCAPGKVCDTFDEFITALETKDYEMEKILKFSEENFRDYDGRAADRVIDEILLTKNLHPCG